VMAEKNAAMALRGTLFAVFMLSYSRRARRARRLGGY
jgi:hypothetical protein